MIDVHAIADDQLARPIRSWTVRAVATGQRLAGIRLENGRFRLETAFGEVSLHAGLGPARDAAAAAFTAPGRAH